jgi:hypothetical protein
MTAEHLQKMFQLFDAVREGIATDDQVAELDEMLKRDGTMCKYYLEYVNMCVLLKSGKAFEQQHVPVPEVCHMDFWRRMADYEKTAPGIALPKEPPKRELIQRVVREKNTYPVSKLSVFTAIFSAAALLFLVLLVKLSPLPDRVEVATLIEQLDVKWAESGVKFKNGDRLQTHQMPLCLDKGIVTMRYDHGVEVVIESPAKFTIERSGIYLEYGRLFSRVSKAGLGFLVETPTARCVDMGTEFGVQAEINGSAELHVIKGQVQLFAGTHSKAKSSRMLTENQAIRYDVNSGQTKPISPRTDTFVRAINSKTKTIWRGQMQINVANIVAGGDGFHEVNALVGLDPLTGKYTNSVKKKDRRGNGTYARVAESDFIDGVFVPDGRTGAVQITSSGLTFDCPETTGVFTHEIAAFAADSGEAYSSIPKLIVQEQTYASEPAVLLHSNVGITFDLQAIRESVLHLSPERFAARGALTQDVDMYSMPDIDFWILVDGQVRYERRALTLEDGFISVEVKLNPHDRFLTLIATDGRRPKDNREFAYGNDFLYLVNPRLLLTHRADR